MDTIRKPVTMFLMFFLSFSVAMAQNDNRKQRPKVHTISINNFSGSINIEEGFWTATKENNSIHVQLMSSRKTNGSFFIRFVVEEKEFIKYAATGFELNRPSGKMIFKGDFPQNESTGTFTFTQHKDFENFLKGKVLNSISQNDRYYYFTLFLGNITRTYVNTVLKRGYKPTLKQLGKLGIHEVSLAYMDALNKTNYRGLELDMLIKFAVHDISINYINELAKAGYGHIDPHMLKRFAIHEVSAGYIKELSKVGYGNLEANMLKNFAVHKISPRYIELLLTAQIDKPAANDIKKAKIHQVSANFIKEARRKGYNSQDLATYIKLKVNGI